MRSARDDGLVEQGPVPPSRPTGMIEPHSVTPQRGALFHMTVDDAFWDDLLLAVEEGHVVPFVGRDLLTVETPTGPEPLHQLVARRLANHLGVDTARLPGGFDPNDVAAAAGSVNPVQVRRLVNGILKGLPVAAPAPLRLLAGIPPLRLFVSTTCDTLLAGALEEVRGSPPAVVVFPSLTSQTDFDEEQLQRQGSFVFQLLGQACRSGFFAVTEGDVLEQMHDLIAEHARWEKLSARLAKSHLLILGVSFPDWLARFLIKLGRRGDPLWTPRDQMEVIVDRDRLSPEFVTFIRLYSPESRLYTGGSPVEFVTELHRRWFERHGSTGARVAAPAGVKPAVMARGSVFISYATEDRAAAFRIADALEAAGLEAWVDRRLHPGDEFSPVIEQHIRQCSAFVALLSRHTQAERGKRYFFREWRLACDEASFLPHGESLLFPVVVDDTPITSMTNLPAALASRSAVFAPGGDMPEALIEQLNRVQRARRKERA
jgi:hypothetical protein